MIQNIRANLFRGLVFLLSVPSVATAALDSLAKVKGVLCLVMGWVYTFALIIGVIYVIIAAIKYISSGGGESVSEANKALMYAGIGIIVALVARGVPSALNDLLGQGAVDGCS